MYVYESCIIIVPSTIAMRKFANARRCCGRRGDKPPEGDSTTAAAPLLLLLMDREDKERPSLAPPPPPIGLKFNTLKKTRRRVFFFAGRDIALRQWTIPKLVRFRATEVTCGCGCGCGGGCVVLMVVMVVVVCINAACQRTMMILSRHCCWQCAIADIAQACEQESERGRERGARWPQVITTTTGAAASGAKSKCTMA